VSSQQIRRGLGWALVLSLCVAALTAIVAVLNGGFDDTDGRVIATSVGFGAFSALGAAGTSPRLQDMENRSSAASASAPPPTTRTAGFQRASWR
jgi:hypothetical protein